MPDEFFTLKLEPDRPLSDAERRACPRVEAAAALILCGGRILAMYNESWGAFTLPITKLHALPRGMEDGLAASRRAAAECLERPVVEPAQPVMDLSDFHASGRDCVVKCYHIAVYRYDLPQANAPDGTGAKWMLPEEFLNEADTWLSPTSKHIIRELHKKGYAFR